METSDSIYFYNHVKKFGYMSNFYSCTFSDNTGLTYNCSEQYLMYQKCLMFEPNNLELLDKIMKETNPTVIKQYGRSVKHYNEEIWNSCRYNIMLEGLKLKFSQNKDIMDYLKDTKNKKLYEASKFDKIWGIGYYSYEAIKIDPSNYGTNLLGKALEEVRTYLLITFG